jgi:O-antigen ligase
MARSGTEMPVSMENTKMPSSSLLRRPLLALAGAVAFTAPLSNHLYVRGLVFVALGALLVGGLQRGRFRALERTEAFVLLFTSYAVLSCLWTPSYAAASWINVVVEYGGVTGVFVLVNRLSDSAAGWRWLGICYVAGSVLVGAVVMYNWMTGLSYEAGRFSVAGVNANFTAYSVVTALPIGTALFVSSRLKRKFVIPAATLLLGFLGAAVVLTGCRGAVLAMAAGALVAACASVVSRPVLGVVGLAMAIVAGVHFAAPVIEAVPQRLLILEALQNSDWSSGRLDIWGRALDVYRDHPVFGVGADAFPSLNPDGVHAHNVVLTVLAEFGAVGMGVFVAAVVPLFAGSFANASMWGRAAALMALLGWLTIALTGVWQFAIPAWFSIAWTRKLGSHISAGAGKREPEVTRSSCSSTLGAPT